MLTDSAGIRSVRPHLDHIVPRVLGGSDDVSNLGPSCWTCNSIKGGRPLETARHLLVLHKLGWPKFSVEEIKWLRNHGVDLSDYDNCRLAFEAT